MCSRFNNMAKVEIKMKKKIFHERMDSTFSIVIGKISKYEPLHDFCHPPPFYEQIIVFQFFFCSPSSLPFENLFCNFFRYFRMPLVYALRRGHFSLNTPILSTERNIFMDFGCTEIIHDDDISVTVVTFARSKIHLGTRWHK